MKNGLKTDNKRASPHPFDPLPRRGIAENKRNAERYALRGEFIGGILKADAPPLAVEGNCGK
ncbi:MAG: hypothetical protein LBP62_01655 [Clostridiales bacterium]|nr:hypothetical protein [Clostridiales bacterium]